MEKSGGQEAALGARSLVPLRLSHLGGLLALNGVALGLVLVAWAEPAVGRIGFRNLAGFIGLAAPGRRGSVGTDLGDRALRGWGDRP